MDFIRGVSRNQVMLFPESVEDYITEDNPVRFIEAFAASLDLAELRFTRVNPAETGWPAYDPADLLRLYIYAYLNRARSSRMLEREAKVNVEVMWLLGKLRPDFKTIADFRRDHLEAIKGVCREFTLLCRKLELFGGELVLDTLTLRKLHRHILHETANYGLGHTCGLSNICGVLSPRTSAPPTESCTAKRPLCEDFINRLCGHEGRFCFSIRLSRLDAKRCLWFVLSCVRDLRTSMP